MVGLVRVRRALLSVSDKAGLIPFALALHARGIELVSTGGTARALRDAGLPVISVDTVTGQPEILSGRVKTLHPAVHGGILAVRTDASHIEQLGRQSIALIDLVCVNLYPFEQTVSKPGVTHEEAIEQIDIGGPAMIRSAAKNHAFVAVVTRPAQYERVLEGLAANDGRTTHALRAELAREAFAHTSRYDAAIASYLSPASDASMPQLMTLTLAKAEDLRYGENPHQAAAVYRLGGLGGGGNGGGGGSGVGGECGPSVLSAEQLHGKELSYNNINDANAALGLALALSRLDPSRVSAAVVKHTNPCGAAIAPASARDAIDEAIAGDPVAAYGGILAVSDVVDEHAAARLCAKDVFLEVVVAPGFSAGALEALRGRWANLRLLATGPFHAHAQGHGREVELRHVEGGMLVQHRDTALTAEFEHRAGPVASDAVVGIARFLEVVVRYLFSNAVVIGGVSPSRPRAVRMFGAGAGQMDRVTACGLAIGKAGALAEGAVAFSDAFFPFSDGPQLLIEAGVTTIVHPGGSKRDEDTYRLCEERGVTCLRSGYRHFRH